ncbi:hypothetical protein BH09PAT4_BH09PAT4_09080 [soil metagenome]
MKRLFLYIVIAVSFTTVLVGGFGPVFASAAATSANVSKSYTSRSIIAAGSIVSLSQTDGDTVELADTSNSKRTIGVVVKDNDSLIAMNSGKMMNTQVATSGIVTTLVSDVNGSIKVGDQVAVSPFGGVGMKSALGERIIGLAQTAFNGSGEDVTTREVKDKSGDSHSIKIGYIQLGVAVGLDDGTDGGTMTGLQHFVRSLTGHQVSTPRIIISLVIAICTLAALIVLIYAAIYGSIVSIGRNPLAKNVIFKALWHVVWLASITVAVALLFMYLLLR